MPKNDRIKAMSGNKTMTTILGIIGILLVVTGAVLFYLKFLRGNPPLKREQLTIITATSTVPSAMTATSTGMLATDTITIDSATFNVEVASTVIEQTNGLSYRTSLAPNDGMLFLFGSSTVQNFWMKDMNFPLDMIWMSGNKVVGFAQNAEPEPGVALWSLKIYTSPDDTDKVLEVNAGMVAQYNIQVGDTVTFGPLQ
jgi:uncharacterized membrane protein (UPF0127 family)